MLSNMLSLVACYSLSHPHPAQCLEDINSSSSFPAVTRTEFETKLIEFISGKSVCYENIND